MASCQKCGAYPIRRKYGCGHCGKVLIAQMPERPAHKEKTAGAKQWHHRRNKRCKISAGEVAIAIRMYKFGRSLAYIGKKLGYSDDTIHRHFLDRKIKTRKPGPRKEDQPNGTL